jgi:hypothetical protein
MNRRTGAALAGVVAMAAVLLGLSWLAQRGWRLPIVSAAGPRAAPTIYAILVGTAAICAVAPATWRRWLLLGGAAIGYPVVLGAWAIPLAGYAGFICVLVRTRLAIRFQVTAAVALWCALPALRILTDSVSGPQTAILAVLWASVIYSALFVIIERRRHPGSASALDELVYFFALPRLAEPFFQPIGGRYFRQHDTVRPSWRLVARGLALAGYGAILSLAVHALATPRPGLPHAVQLLCDLVRFYAMTTSQLFCSIALFRLLGFDLASGFRLPFLSRSFSEFFRRYNHYVRDAVISLFYFPLLGSLRKTLHPRAAVVLSSFGSIFIGSYVLNDFLVPVVTAVQTRAALRSATAPAHLAVLGVYWSLIVIPPLLALPKRADGRPWLPGFIKIVIFNIAFFLIWLHIGWHHQMKTR